MKICERCGAEHDGSFGSGRFCSRSCANARTHSDETKEKIKSSVNSFLLNKNGSDFVNKRKRSKLDRQKRIDEFIERVKSSDDMKFVTYPNMDFGEKYVVTKSGEVISVHTLKPVSRIHNHNEKFADAYQRVVLSEVDGSQHMLLIHRLVAIAFLSNDNNYPVVNHKDENPENNCVDNLEWCTYQYNAMYNDAHIKRGKMLHEKYIKNKK